MQKLYKQNNDQIAFIGGTAGGMLNCYTEMCYKNWYFHVDET